MGYEMRVERIIVTPEFAKEMLSIECNAGNRNFRPKHCEQIKRDIIAGKWEFNGDPIRISKDGQLLDGQHRLRAVLETGIPIESMVIRGFEMSVNRVIDISAPRSNADYLQYKGLKNASTIAAAVSWYYRWEHGQLHQGYRSKITKAEIDLILENYPNIVESVSVVLNRNTQLRCLGIGSFLCFLHSLACDFGHKEKADIFMERLASGEMMNNTSPILKLRETLISNRTARRKLAHVVCNAIAIKAWNKYLKNEPCSILRYSSDGEKPEAYPQIEM